MSGIPVRPEFLQNATSFQESNTDDEIRVLIFGGSQGAHAINVAVVEAAEELAAIRPRLRVTHQTGERDVEMVRAGYRQAGLVAEVEPFLYDMGRHFGAGTDCLPRGGDDGVGDYGRWQAGDSDPVADGDRRPPAQERRGAGVARRGRRAASGGDAAVGAGGPGADARRGSRRSSSHGRGGAGARQA